MLIFRVDYVPEGKTEEEIPQQAAMELIAAAVSFVASHKIGDVKVSALVLGHEMEAFPFSTQGVVVDRWRERVRDAQSTGYTCSHCGVSSPKDAWGPGRITCPRCRKMAPAADGSPRP